MSVRFSLHGVARIEISATQIYDRTTDSGPFATREIQLTPSDGGEPLVVKVFGDSPIEVAVDDPMMQQRPLSDADAERLGELVKVRNIYGVGDLGGRLRNVDFLLRLLAEARGNPMMQRDRDEPDRDSGLRP